MWLWNVPGFIFVKDKKTDNLPSRYQESILERAADLMAGRVRLERTARGANILPLPRALRTLRQVDELNILRCKNIVNIWPSVYV